MEDEFDIRDARVPESEREYENALRPLSFHDFSGQAKVVENLKIFVMAARMRKEALDHVLLHGPPGLGKTTLSLSLIHISLRFRTCKNVQTPRRSRISRSINCRR